MSFVATFNAFQVSGISKPEQHVLAAICTFANKNGICWPTTETIAARCLSSVRTVQTHMNSLVSKGLIERIHRKGRPTTTRVLVPQTLTPTPATSAPLPPQLLHPKPAIEPVNTITAAPPSEPLPAAVSPPLLFSEIPEQPKTAVEPLRTEDATYQLTDVGQTITGRFDASIPETTANETVAKVANTLAIDPLAEVPTQLLQDLGEVRRNKKKPAKVTKTEANMWFSEAQKAGWTMQQVIMTMILRGWSRFEASWVEHVPQQVAPSQTKVWEPDPHTPASPEVVAAAKAKLATLRAQIILDSARKRVDQVACRR